MKVAYFVSLAISLTLILTFEFATALSLRRNQGPEYSRELQSSNPVSTQYEVRSYGVSIHANKPYRPDNISTCVSKAVSQLVQEWAAITYYNETFMALSDPLNYRSGQNWTSGSMRRHLVVVKKPCSYYCFILGILSCKLCGPARSRRRRQMYMSNNSRGNQTIKWSGNLTSSNETSLSSWNRTSVWTTNHSSNYNASGYSFNEGPEYYGLENLIKISLSEMCPEIQGIDHVHVTVGTQLSETSEEALKNYSNWTWMH